jgi:hypothetical protein|tara:strand:- start:272 stop:817 length:546 start_codon:yes stop_codon:yes gene_type:complete
MPSKIITGDLVQLVSNGEFDVVIHGCNCFNIMKNGLSKHLSEKFPNIDAADKKTLRGDRKKLGTYSYSVEKKPNGEPFVILNCYTQYNYGVIHYKQGGFDYSAFEQLLAKIKARFSGRNLKICYPLIACDRGNADLEKVLTLIDHYLTGEDHTLILFKEPGRRKANSNYNKVKKLYPSLFS